MGQKNRYSKEEEDLLCALKRAHPAGSWGAIAELYNAKIADSSRLRTEEALHVKFKKMQALEKRMTRKRFREPARAKSPPNEGQEPQNGAVPNSFLLSVPREGIEYEISFLQWHLGTLLDDVCAATACVLDDLRK